MRRLTAIILSAALLVGFSLAAGVSASYAVGPTEATPPTTAVVSDVASLATLTASSQNPASEQLAVKATDRVVAGYPGDYTKEWATVLGKQGSWLKLAWASPVSVSKIVLYDRPNLNDQITAATITFSDGSVVTTGSLPNNGTAQAIAFATRTITWLKVTVNGVASTTMNIGLAEIEVWGTSATAPALPTTTTTTAKLTTTTTTPPPTTATTVPSTTTTTWSTTTTAAPGVNAALSALASASSENAATGQLATKAMDGVVAGYPGDYTKEWATEGEGAGSWVKMAWPSARRVNKIVLHDRPNPDDQITAASISFSDGSTLSVGALANDGSAVTVTFPVKTITGLELNVSGVSGTTQNVGLAEVEVWTDGTAPAPGTTTTLRATTTTTPSTSTTTTHITSTTLPATTSTTLPATTTTTMVGTGRVITVTSTIQAAVNQAAPGDKIYIPAGTWSGAVVFNGKSNIEMYGTGAASIVRNDGSDDPIIQIPSGSNMVFHDFSIQGNYDRWSQQGLGVEKLSGGKFYNLTFKSIGYAAAQFRTWAYDRWDTAISNVEFYNNTVDKAGEFGIYIGAGVSGFKCRGNSFGPCEGRMYPPHAVYVQDANNVWVEDNYAYGTTRSNGFAYKAGVQTTHGHIFDVHFNRNKSVGCFGGLWLVAAEDVYASGNQFLNSQSEGVQLWADNKRVYLDGNTFGGGYWAIRFATDGLWSSDIHLTNNTAVGSSGLELSDGPASMIVENSGNSWQ